MIYGLHWTLLALLQLTAGCALLNFAQWRAVGVVRLSGLLICAAWAVQQTWWATTGDKSLALTLTCDGLLLWFFWSRRASNDWSDWLICALILATMTIYIPEYLNGETAQGWWLNTFLVMVQMVLGLPRGASQPIAGAVSHGRLRDHGGA